MHQLKYVCTLWGAALLAMMSVAGPTYACCSYGCCDCSCVSLRLEKRAQSIASTIEKSLPKDQGKGSVQSFRVSLSKEKGSGSKWSCSPAKNGAMCTRR